MCVYIYIYLYVYMYTYRDNTITPESNDLGILGILPNKHLQRLWERVVAAEKRTLEAEAEGGRRSLGLICCVCVLL